MNWKSRSAAVLAVVAVAACNDSTGAGNGIEVADLVGTWNATVLEFTNQANTSQKVDLIAMGGSVSMVVSSNGNYALTITFPGDPAEVEAGTISINGNLLTLTETGEVDPTEFVANLSGNTLTLTSSDEEYDFDDDDSDEPASLRVVFAKQ